MRANHRSRKEESERVLAADDRILRELYPERVASGEPAPTSWTERDRIYGDEYYRRLELNLGRRTRDRLCTSATNLSRIMAKAWEDAGRPAPPRGKLEGLPDLLEVDYLARSKRIVPCRATSFVAVEEAGSPGVTAGPVPEAGPVPAPASPVSTSGGSTGATLSADDVMRTPEPGAGH